MPWGVNVLVCSTGERVTFSRILRTLWNACAELFFPKTLPIRWNASISMRHEPKAYAAA